MKIRGSIILFIALCVILIIFLLWHGRVKSMVPPTATVPTSISPTNAPANPPVQSNTTIALAKGGGITNSLPPSKGQQMLAILSTYNDVPIDFYGKVEDQSGSGVPNAVIMFNIRIENGTESTVQRGQVTADDNGVFSITGYKGQDLGLIAKKPGYTLATTETLFKYSPIEDHPFVANPGNPQIIKMWKQQGPASVVNINLQYKLHYTNAPINFDLIAGQIVPIGGDVILTVTRPGGTMSGRNRMDWSVQLASVDGGVIDSQGQESTIFEAPSIGYLPNMTFIFSTNAPYKWVEEFDQGLFVVSRNNQVYSKLGLSFRINKTPDDYMYISFNGIASTNGSRAWEQPSPQ